MNASPSLSIVISSDDLSALRKQLFTPDGCENFAVLFCGTARGAGWTRLLVRETMPTPPSGYRERLNVHLEIEPAFFNRVVDHALVTGLSPVVVHSHPGSATARYSRSDDYGEGRLLPVLQQLLPTTVPASLLLSEEAVCARTLANGRFVPFQSVEVKGLSSALCRLDDAPEADADEEFDRTVRAVGPDGLATLRALRVGIVGLGGTGSAVAEELVRLGVEDLVLIDPDVLELSNLPRVWGALPADATGRAPKVDVIANHLRRIRPAVQARSVPGDFVRQGVLSELRDRDLVFGCTDNHLSRSVLNRFSHQYLVPVVDMGIRLDARTGAVTAAGGRVTLVGEGLTCLKCSGHIDPLRIREEALPAAEREALAHEGYVQGVDAPQPAVVSLNTVVASLAVTAGLGLYVNLVGQRPPVDQIIDFTCASLFSVSARHSPLCDVCSADGGLKGLGDAQIVSAYE